MPHLGVPEEGWLLQIICSICPELYVEDLPGHELPEEMPWAEARSGRAFPQAPQNDQRASPPLAFQAAAASTLSRFCRISQNSLIKRFGVLLSGNSLAYCHLQFCRARSRHWQEPHENRSNCRGMRVTFLAKERRSSSLEVSSVPFSGFAVNTTKETRSLERLTECPLMSKPTIVGL